MTSKDENKKQSRGRKIETAQSEKKAGKGARIWQTLAIPLLAVFTGLLIGAIVIVVTDAAVIAAYKNFFHDPLRALGLTFQTIGTAYGALFTGAFGSPDRIISAIKAYSTSGDSQPMVNAIWPITESLVSSTPYILVGLAVALEDRPEREADRLRARLDPF